MQNILPYTFHNIILIFNIFSFRCSVGFESTDRTGSGGGVHRFPDARVERL